MRRDTGRLGWPGWLQAPQRVGSELLGTPKAGDLHPVFPLLPQRGLISYNMCLSSTDETELLPWVIYFFTSLHFKLCDQLSFFFLMGLGRGASRGQRSHLLKLQFSFSINLHNLANRFILLHGVQRKEGKENIIQLPAILIKILTILNLQDTHVNLRRKQKLEPLPTLCTGGH